MTGPAADGSPDRFRRLVGSIFGLEVDDTRLGDLGDLLARRTAATGEDAAAYLDRLDRDPRAVELDRLAEDLTVGETFFFRHSDQFRALVETVLPERVHARGDAPLAVLSAGCASGEEPYSIAMLLRDLPGPLPPVALHAVDLNPEALRRAARARYGAWAMRETPADAARRWFAGSTRDMVLHEEIRSAVTFARANLSDPADPVWRPGFWDVIFCRNVIMYFRPEVQRQVIASAAASLADGGYLFLGHAESLRGLSREFDLVNTHGAFYYRRRPRAHGLSRRPVLDLAPPPAPIAPHRATTGRSATEPAAALSPALPDPPAERFEVALDLMRRERFAEALDLIAAMPPVLRRDPDVLLLQATLLAQAGRYAAAGEACTDLLARDPLSPGANYVLGLCLEGLGDAAGAIERYRIASHADRHFAMPVLRCGLLARRTGDIVTAARDLARAADLLTGEDPARLLLFGGGFTRAALVALCEPVPSRSIKQ